MNINIFSNWFRRHPEDTAEHPTTPSSGPPDFWCFISYRHLDNREDNRRWATWLHRQLETYEVPADLVGTSNERNEIIPARIFPVFRDEEELSAGKLTEKIYDALDRTRTLVVLCSPRVTATDSRYVNEEIRYFKKAGRSRPVFAALLEGTPETSFPETLSYAVDAEGKTDKERKEDFLAPHFCLRDGNQGWTTSWAYSNELRKDDSLSDEFVEKMVEDYSASLANAKFQIIAGVLGVPLDRLLRREKAYQLEIARKKNRNLRNWLAAVGALAVAAIVATAVASHHRKVAENQRAVAEANFEVAKGAADSLVTDIVKDLRDVDGMRVEAVRKILTKAETAYDKLLAGSPGNKELLIGKASMYREFVSTYAQVGDTDSAAKSARASCRIIEGLMADSPADESLEDSLADGRLKLGDALIEIGDAKGADLNYSSSLSIYRNLSARHPENASLMKPVSAALLRLAEVDEMLGNTEAGEARVREALSIRRELVKTNVSAEPELLVSLTKLLDFAILKKDFALAETTAIEVRTIARRLPAADPTNARYLRYFAIFLQRMGNLYISNRSFQDAETFYQESLDQFVALSQTDPGNKERKQDVAIANQKLASSASKLGNLALARNRYREAIGIRETLTTDNPDVYQWKLDLAETYFELGRLESAEMRRGCFSKAQVILMALNTRQSLGDEPRGWLDEINAEIGM